MRTYTYTSNVSHGQTADFPSTNKRQLRKRKFTAVVDGEKVEVSPPKSYTPLQKGVLDLKDGADGEDLTTEGDRLRTFSSKLEIWPRCAAIQPHQLAAEGFYYSGVKDEVCCCSCNVKLRQWKAEDNVRERHRKASPSCSFLIKKDSESGRQQHQMSVNETSHGMEEESERLATFSCKWPSYCPVEPSGLAKSGFFYTGHEDSVQCFSCRITLKGWEHGDTAEGEHRRHSPFCPFLNGNDRLNVPRNTSRQRLLPKQKLRPIANLQFEHVRIQTFTNWPHSISVPPNDLAEAGFYFTGNKDVVQCFCCSVVVEQWDLCDIPVEEHLKYSPECSFAKAVAQRKMQGKRHCTPQAQSTAKLVNSYEQRLVAFKNWPQDAPVSAQDLAMAGFYSTGLGDEVKCFSCGGALKCWQRGDSAWGEHSQYFPSCQYVQQYAPITVVSSHDEPWNQPLTKKQQRDEYVQIAIEMGFSKELASQVLSRHQTTVNSFGSFLDLLIDQSETTAASSGSCQSATLTQQSTLVPTAPPQSLNLHDEVVQGRQSRKCKVCMEKEADIVFVPCAHVICHVCANSAPKCLVCRSQIECRIPICGPLSCKK